VLVLSELRGLFWRVRGTKEASQRRCGNDCRKVRRMRNGDGGRDEKLGLGFVLGRK